MQRLVEQRPEVADRPTDDHVVANYLARAQRQFSSLLRRGCLAIELKGIGKSKVCPTLVPLAIGGTRLHQDHQRRACPFPMLTQLATLGVWLAILPGSLPNEAVPSTAVGLLAWGEARVDAALKDTCITMPPKQCSALDEMRLRGDLSDVLAQLTVGFWEAPAAAGW